MATYRNVQMSFWTDSKITDDFTPEDKLFFLYVMTNPRTSLCGCYECSKKQMSRDIGYSEETISNIIYRMDVIHKVAKYDDETREILILNWDKYNWTESSKVLDGAFKGAVKIKSKEFRYFVLNKLEQRGYPVPHELFEEIGYAYPMDKTVAFPFTVTDNVNVSHNKPTGRFTPPTVEEVSEYIREKQYHVDAESFIAFYQSKGWKVGNQPMKDWKAAVRTWETRWKERQTENEKKRKGRVNWDELNDTADGGLFG